MKSEAPEASRDAALEELESLWELSSITEVPELADGGGGEPPTQLGGEPAEGDGDGFERLLRAVRFVAVRAGVALLLGLAAFVFGLLTDTWQVSVAYLAIALSVGALVAALVPGRAASRTALGHAD
ncbi:MAG: hypothetical protein ACR2NH_11295 [Solirubrobacteraceae bacterium]